MKINVKKYSFVFFAFSLFHFFSVISIAQDVPYNLYTPRNSPVLNTYDTQEMSAPEIAYWNNYYQTNYPNATQVQPSTREYNCHGYAWSVSVGGPQVWIGYSTPVGAEEVYWSDGSYDQVSESVATKVSYSGDHSAITSGTPNYYYSKWNKYPLMYHHKDYTPGYGTANQFFRRSIDVPQDFSSINNAISNAVSGQTCVVSSGNYTMTGNITIGSGITLTLNSGVNINFNGYYIEPSGGTFNINNSSTVYLINGNKYYGLFTSVQSAINNASSNQTVELLATSYSESPSFSSKSNITLSGQGSSSTIINSSISVTNSSNIQISGMRIANGVYSNNSQLVYVSSCDFPGSTLFCDYGSTNTNVSNSTAQIGSASFAVNLYGGTGNVFYNTVKNYDCGVFLSNSASYNIGDLNTFCNNGADIYAQNGAYAYAISNTYSLPVPQSIYGNVFITGVNSVCNLQKASPFQINAANTFDSKLLKDADDKYLALLRKINEDSKKEKYDRNKYEADYSKLIDDYKNVVNIEKEKQIVKAALTKLNHLYKAKEDKNSFDVYLDELAGKKSYQQYLPYIQRYSIWNFVDKNEYENSILVADEILKNSTVDEDLTCEMLYEKGLIYKYYIKRQSKAEEMFGELISNHPKHLLAKYASNESGIELKEQGSIKTMESEETVGYSLDNYPNPFNPSTTISYSLPQAGHVTLKVYDVLGREVAELVNSVKERGKHSVVFNAGKYASGFYIYTIRVNDYYASKKMLLAK